MTEARRPYLEQIERALPRILSLFDLDPLSTTYGVGDRRYWAWRTIDYPNATYQGAVHGLARLLEAELLPPWVDEATVSRILDSAIRAIPAVRDGDGSVVEAFPREGSYCVTALVAFDLLAAVDLLSARVGERARVEYLDLIRPLVRFVSRSRETHAVIANHLATAAAALCRWEDATGETVGGRAAVARVLATQSSEGWFREYDGADPGYQTLAMYYLADIHQRHPELGLAEPLTRSLAFLRHFAHPDGSFGGSYGSRDTRFYAPGGIEVLAAGVPDACALALHMRDAIARRAVVALDAMDEPNLVPMFNAYCRAAEGAADLGHLQPPPLPACAGRIRAVFEDAGIVVDGGDEHYTVISWHKGGVCQHYVRDRPALTNAGAVARDAEGAVYTTQVYRRANRVTIADGVVTIDAPLSPLERELPSPLQFAAVRILAVSAFRIGSVRERFKRALVRRLFAPARTVGLNRRIIRLGRELTIDDEWVGAEPPLQRDAVTDSFSVLHMASYGYWQRS